MRKPEIFYELKIEFQEGKRTRELPFFKIYGVNKSRSCRIMHFTIYPNEKRHAPTNDSSTAQ